jgi:hypothetical protein
MVESGTVGATKKKKKKIHMTSKNFSANKVALFTPNNGVNAKN